MLELLTAKPLSVSLLMLPLALLDFPCHSLPAWRVSLFFTYYTRNSSQAVLKLKAFSSIYNQVSLFNHTYILACGGQLTTPTGVITSPNYPGYYAHNRDCRWFITAPQGKRITLTFEDFAIEPQATCLFDYVEVRLRYKHRCHFQ